MTNDNIFETQEHEEDAQHTEDEEGDLYLANGPGEIVIEKADRSLAEFHRWFQRGRLIVDPEWQRNYVWSNKQASRLIESFLLGIPLPVVYLAKDEEGRYEVIDGLQRLTSVFKFFENQVSLTGLQVLSQLNGKRFADIPPSLQQRLEDSLLRSFELDARTQKDLMFIIFERLNTGGTKLNEMEIRNCLYRGKLNDLIRELAENDDFKAVLSQTGLSRRMNDRTFVLRFLAFYERTPDRCRSGLKAFLNEFMDTYRNPSDAKLDEYRRVFKSSMAAAHTIFGQHGFRRLDARGGWSARPSVAIFQAVAVGLAQYRREQLTRRADAILEEYVDMITSDERWGDATTKSTGEHANLVYASTTWRERLALAIGDEQPNDSVRCFSSSLKREMFATNRQCSLCSNDIRTIEDAALDHELHYWRGGRTVPENARLVHRSCNMRRSHVN